MITLNYSGNTFTEVSFNGYEHEARFHGPDFMYIEHILHLRVLWNPKIFIRPGDNKGFVAQIKPYLDALFPPRGTFKLEVMGKQWLFVEPPDCDWGPKVLYCRVAKVVGGKSAFLDVGFRVCVRETPKGPKGEINPLVLSNRWTTSVETSASYWQARRIIGEIVIRSDQMTRQHLQLSDIKKAFILPVDPRYKRDDLVITVSEDGLVGRYTYVDKQVPYVVVPPYIADCEVSGMIQAGRSSENAIAQAAYNTGMEIVGSGFQTAGYAAWGANPRGLAASFAGESVLKMFKTGIDAGAARIPTVQLAITATASGLPTATMTLVQSFASAVAAAKALQVPTQPHHVEKGGDQRKIDCFYIGAHVNASARTRTVSVTLVLEKAHQASYYNGLTGAAVNMLALRPVDAFNSLNMGSEEYDKALSTPLREYAERPWRRAFDSITESDEKLLSRTRGKPSNEGLVITPTMTALGVGQNIEGAASPLAPLLTAALTDGADFTADSEVRIFKP